jgi:glutaredoxin-related protein
MADIINCPHGLPECPQCKYDRILAQVLKDLEKAMEAIQTLERECCGD